MEAGNGQVCAQGVKSGQTQMIENHKHTPDHPVARTTKTPGRSKNHCDTPRSVFPKLLGNPQPELGGTPGNSATEQYRISKGPCALTISYISDKQEKRLAEKTSPNN